MPRLREDQQPDAVIDLRHRSQQRAPTDEVVLVDDGPGDIPPAPVFTQEPVLLDAPGTTRKRRRVAELEAIAAVNARAAVEARAIALEQRRHLEAATDAWRSTASQLADLRRDLKGFAAARADLIAKERARAEQTARTDVEAQLHRLEAGHAELQTEIDRLRVALAEQQGLNGDTTQHLRDEQRKRAEAEKEAQRAIAAYETAERRLETASEALRRHAADEQARIEAAEDALAAAEAELEALGGGGQVAKLTGRVDDLVLQLGELDAELVAMESRAEKAEAAAAVAAADLAAAGVAAERARAEAGHALDEIGRERDALLVRVAGLEQVGEQREARATEAQARADSAEVTVTDVEGALASARGEAEAATDRATVARVRLDEIVHERDALLAAVATLEHDAAERERRAADAARAVAARELAGTAGLEEALVAARFDSETLRGETAALAAQLEEAWSQVEAARRAGRAGAPDATDAAVDVESTDAGDSLLDAFAELAATPDDDDDGILDEARERPVEREVRMAPPAPDPEDPDARRAALGFLNSLAKDLPASRPHGN